MKFFTILATCMIVLLSSQTDVVANRFTALNTKETNVTTTKVEVYANIMKRANDAYSCGVLAYKRAQSAHNIRGSEQQAHETATANQLSLLDSERKSKIEAAINLEKSMLKNAKSIYNSF